jgi:hypothetical protein
MTHGTPKAAMTPRMVVRGFLRTSASILLVSMSTSMLFVMYEGRNVAAVALYTRLFSVSRVLRTWLFGGADASSAQNGFVD